MNPSLKCLAALFICLPGLSVGVQAQSPAQAPLFVENRGQWPAPVSFAARGAGWRVATEARGWRLALSDGESRACVVRMSLLGGEGPPAQGLDVQAAPSHFFRRGVSVRDARSFARLRFAELAPGVDLVLRCAEGQLEYDLALGPDADLTAVVFEVEGAELDAIGADGSLELITPLGVLRQSPPRAFECDAAGVVHDSASRFVRLDATHFGFEVPLRRAGTRLLIDPALVWSTYIGGGATQSVRAIVDDSLGGALIAGSTDSFDFPTTVGVFDTSHNGASDVFVSALDAQGRLRWSSFLGGLGADEASAIAWGNGAALTLVGTTRSSDFPTSAGAFDTSLGGVADGFVARLTNAGSQLAWSTFLGGSKHDELHALALDAGGEVLVGGWTLSNNFPVTPGSFGQQLAFGVGPDACVSRVLADGSGLLWSSYLGGSNADRIEALALTPGGVLVGGATSSSDFPCTLGGAIGGEDGFVARLQADATQLLMSTTLGGFGDDSVLALVAGSGGNAFVAGRSNSPTLPVTAGAFGPVAGGLDDGFLVQVDPQGAIVACSYLGGSTSDEILALSRAASGELFACGWTDSVDFPTTPGALDKVLNVSSGSSASDGFVARVSPDLSSLSYSTYFGAGDEERAWALAAIDADTVLLAGETTSYFFPTTPGAHRTSRGVLALLEGFASRLDLLQHPIPYGLGKLHSFGGQAQLTWTGFPSVQEHNFQLVVDSAIPNQLAVIFVGPQSWNQAFLGGTLYVRPPCKRVGKLLLDFSGYAELPYALNAPAIGTTFYAQAWFRDPWDSLGCGLSSGLEVLVYP